jgi:hypothetical protein
LGVVFLTLLLPTPFQKLKEKKSNKNLKLKSNIMSNFKTYSDYIKTRKFYVASSVNFSFLLNHSEELVLRQLIHVCDLKKSLSVSKSYRFFSDTVDISIRTVQSSIKQLTYLKIISHRQIKRNGENVYTLNLDVLEYIENGLDADKIKDKKKFVEEYKKSLAEEKKDDISNFSAKQNEIPSDVIRPTKKEKKDISVSQNVQAEVSINEVGLIDLLIDPIDLLVDTTDQLSIGKICQSVSQNEQAPIGKICQAVSNNCQAVSKDCQAPIGKNCQTYKEDIIKKDNWSNEDNLDNKDTLKKEEEILETKKETSEVEITEVISEFLKRIDETFKEENYTEKTLNENTKKIFDNAMPLFKEVKELKISKKEESDLEKIIKRKRVNLVDKFNFKFKDKHQESDSIGE